MKTSKTDITRKENLKIPVNRSPLKNTHALNGRSVKQTRARDHFDKGIGCIEEKKHDLAHLCFNRAISMEPQNWEYYAQRARNHVCFKNFVAAREDLKNAISYASSEPKDTRLSLHYAAAVMENRLENYSKALALVNELLADCPPEQFINVSKLKFSIEQSMRKQQ